MELKLIKNGSTDPADWVVEIHLGALARYQQNTIIRLSWSEAWSLLSDLQYEILLPNQYA